ncbi:hypothetical protein Fcan01_23998 [Folsomia candida]|uniref:Uncharacterized protein n=1 Tax=Folsomia candida TaxID=158441 RepID=A0A226D6G9_FOLCA|nr:hypothetical protein Fcan01_23998 [Folsomia candida]
MGNGQRVPARVPVRKVAIFQKIQILTSYYNHASTPLLTRILSVLVPSALCITCCFAAIRFHIFLPFFQYIPFPTIFNNEFSIIAVTLIPATAIYESSNNLCLHIRKKVDAKMGKMWRKKLTALHPLGVQIGPICKVRKIAILLCYNFIANYIFTLLITFPHEKVVR